MSQGYGAEVGNVSRVTQFIFWTDNGQTGSKDKTTFPHMIEIQFFLLMVRGT